MDKPKILIVDDDERSRKLLDIYLQEDIECYITQASDGREALEILKNVEFDLIFLDIKMRGISGIDVIKKVKLEAPKTDILVVSGWDSNAVANEAVKCGALDFIVKPYKKEEICAEVSEILRKRNQYFPKSS